MREGRVVRTRWKKEKEEVREAVEGRC